MIDFTFTEEQQMLREVARKFTENEVRPRAAEIDEKEEAPLDLIRKAAELGFLGVVFPEKYGGGGCGEVAYCLLLEEISRGCNSTAVTIGGHESLGSMSYLAGTEEQKAKYLVPLAEGRKLATYALSEAGAGSDAGGIRRLSQAKHPPPQYRRRLSCRTRECNVLRGEFLRFGTDSAGA